MFYCLDTLPIIVCFAFYILYNPVLLLPRPEELESDDKGMSTNNAEGVGSEDLEAQQKVVGDISEQK